MTRGWTFCNLLHAKTLRDLVRPWNARSIRPRICTANLRQARPTQREHCRCSSQSSNESGCSSATDGLTTREKQLVQKLVDASRLLESIYWRQSDPRDSRSTPASPAAPARPTGTFGGSSSSTAAATICSRSNKPFVGKDPYPPGRESFPKGSRRRRSRRTSPRIPTKKAEIYNPRTVVKRQGSELVAVPYHVEYREWLVPAAKALRDAAALSDDKAFANFLRLRADALLSDDYYPSDSRGSIWRIRSSTSSSRPTRRTSTTCSASKRRTAPRC